MNSTALSLIQPLVGNAVLCFREERLMCPA